MRRQPCGTAVYNKVGGSRRGLSIQLSSIFTYPACFWNQGVRIIEVLLYSAFITFATSWYHIVNHKYMTCSTCKPQAATGKEEFVGGWRRCSIENLKSRAYSKDMIHQRCDLGLSYKTSWKSQCWPLYCMETSRLKTFKGTTKLLLKD